MSLWFWEIFGVIHQSLSFFRLNIFLLYWTIFFRKTVYYNGDGIRNEILWLLLHFSCVYVNINKGMGKRRGYRCRYRCRFVCVFHCELCDMEHFYLCKFDNAFFLHLPIFKGGFEIFISIWDGIKFRVMLFNATSWFIPFPTISFLSPIFIFFLKR